MMGLGAVTLGSLVIGTLALLWGFARMLRGGSASASFGIAFAGIAGCLLLLLLRPQHDITQPIGSRSENRRRRRRRPFLMTLGSRRSGDRGSIRATAREFRVALGVMPAAEGLADGAPLRADAGGGP